MRTKLDDIVEDERSEFLNRTGIGKRIAERAFRHGVEQARDWVNWSQNNGDAIQPAPAGEKVECTRDGKCPPFAHVFCLPDRRKGQRRKGAEQALATVYELGTSCDRPMFQNRHGGPWYFDRRSGNDRRRESAAGQYPAPGRDPE